MLAAAIGGATWGVPAPTTASGLIIRTDEQPPSVDDAKSDLDAARAEFEAAQKTEAAAQRRAEKASQAAHDAERRANRAEARAERARAESKDAAASSSDAREELGRLAAHAYANNAELGRLAALGAAVDPQQFQRRSNSISELMRVQDTLVREAAESRANAANAAQRAQGQAEAAAAASADAQQLEQEAKAALDEAAAAAQDAESALAEVKQVYEAAQEAAREREAEREREAAEENPSRGDRGEEPTQDEPTGSGEFIMPSSGPITSPYGMRVHPLTGVYKLHSGTDFGASCGATVSAASAGTVESAEYAGAYGNQVTISHGVINGLDVTTTYNHLSSFAVSAGQSVSTGDQIGSVGTTGSSTGCHLHFEVLVNGEFTNPMSWLP
ncbi:murein DD-endopeptidase MepM/ murein hydrolase activator NlpD [Haloactinopolyspora alba]|uniref:Murein DD-endopeptidase MepM/ murein hydrolase activator NlpD n=2 Tax=Haloactinopolyspora alba TaxID=648780 RepID=A0A2P8DLY5_9ACTN|nr:murein DD-endopeptidase MepM/ murein hydrolase activator NlpD [Haloactinopolyspora alba]